MALYSKFRTQKRKCVLAFLVSILFIALFHTTLILAGRDVIYLLRPLWDSPPVLPKHLITHYYAPNISAEKLCHAHGWTPRDKGSIPRVIDAFIFSVELDMLEIRMRELWNVVDIFIVVEADKTFTGKGKPLVFLENQEKFQWAQEKLVHFVVRELDSNPKKDFQNEANLRGYMTDFVRRVNPNRGDLIIISDIDELPYPHTIQLLKSCHGYEEELHLELRNFLYSFEFPLQTTNWKPHVATYDPSTFWYHHGRHKSTQLLADAGWHCSFCFRYISDFVFKMTSYSHSDRVTRDRLLDEKEIQQKICSGADIFDMLPEAYTYKELISQMGTIKKSSSTIGIPQHVVEKPETFKFLLPGGCIRERKNDKN